MSGIPSELRSKRFLVKTASRTLAALGTFSVVFGVIDVFFPGLLANFGGTIWLALGVSCIIGLRLAWPQPIEARYSMPQTSVRILPGDLFDNEAASEHLIVGVSTSFDTRSPIIAPGSLQGQFLQRIYLNDADRLDADLAVALGPYEGEAKIIEGKMNGNKMSYPIGTTAVLQAPNRTAFLLAYTKMDKEDHVSTDVDLVWESLTSVWDRVRVRGNATVVRMGVVGGGLANLSSTLPAMDAIRFQVLSFMLASRRERVCDGLTIVVRPEQYEKLDHTVLHDFLKSLES
ncbi:macro domain-containing protein [Glutamicibacter halophytocola]|uniref:macro domain-containing protein n=1 Tax=Glutamicibacter halophytocola TaxID=1933880 RepID=UPI0015C5483F|nr:macro domain-containing protein [Glutamicibacter halophytocola]NQD41636.1 hypothetical protein [Glutamicibacter halophytocola]